MRQAIAEHRPQTYLVSRRTLRSMNSWMNNVPVLSRGKDRCTLLIHPDDAAALDVDDRDHVAVTSGESRIVVPVELTPHIKRGVVSMPHGWGHDRPRSEEHTSELQSLMRNSYAVFCLKKTKSIVNIITHTKLTPTHTTSI